MAFSSITSLHSQHCYFQELGSVLSFKLKSWLLTRGLRLSVHTTLWEVKCQWSAFGDNLSCTVLISVCLLLFPLLLFVCFYLVGYSNHSLVLLSTAC